MRTAILMAGIFIADGLRDAASVESTYNDDTLSFITIVLCIMIMVDIVDFIKGVVK